ncbi:unnamed protein product [Malus baccata var. baccata]
MILSFKDIFILVEIWNDANTFSVVISSSCNTALSFENRRRIEAMEYARINGLDLLTVCPTLVFGPILQYIANTLVLIKLLKGT